MKKFSDLSLENYLNELSSAEPIPGGGSVSAYVGSLAMGLTQMVGKISLKRKKKEGLPLQEAQKEEERRTKIEKIVESVEKIKRDAFSIVNLDPVAYEEVTKAYGQPEKMEDALWKSFEMQAELAFLILLGRERNAELMTLVSGSIKNDLLVSEALSKAAFDGAYDTAMINVVYMKNEEHKKKAEKTLQELKDRFHKGAIHVR